MGINNQKEEIKVALFLSEVIANLENATKSIEKTIKFIGVV